MEILEEQRQDLVYNFQVQKNHFLEDTANNFPNEKEWIVKELKWLGQFPHLIVWMDILF